MRINLIVILIGLGLLSFKHPFYLGITELKYSEKEKSMQVTVKLFTNDLEDALGKLNGKKPDLINGTEKKELIAMLNDYLSKYLSLKINDKTQKPNFIGFEHENDAIWMYLEIRDCLKPSKIEIENSLLYDLLKSQTNIVHCEVNGEKKSSKLSYPEKNLTFSF